MMVVGLIGVAGAQTWPDKPIKIIVPSAAGGPTDVPARLASLILPPRIGQPIVVENRPGADGAASARPVLDHDRLADAAAAGSARRAAPARRSGRRTRPAR